MEEGEELDWLSRRGGWVLLSVGLLLIGLAVVVVKHEAVASIFVFSGLATAILGVLLPRLEGTFEISISKIVATLRAARKVGTRDDLTFDERANEVFKLLQISGDAAGAEPVTTAISEEEVEGKNEEASSAVHVPLPRPVEFVVTGESERIHAVTFAFERHVAEAFRRDGWEVEERSSDPDDGIDVIARRNDDIAYVQVKLSRRFSAADIGQLPRHFQRIDPRGEAQHVLAINMGALSAASRTALAFARDVAVLEFPVSGW